jgi:hypothetical protein
MTPGNSIRSALKQRAINSGICQRCTRNLLRRCFRGRFKMRCVCKRRRKKAITKTEIETLSETEIKKFRCLCLIDNGSN